MPALVSARKWLLAPLALGLMIGLTAFAVVQTTGGVQTAHAAQTALNANAQTNSGEGTHWSPTAANALGPSDGTCVGGTNLAGFINFTFPGFGIDATHTLTGIQVTVKLSGTPGNAHRAT